MNNIKISPGKLKGEIKVPSSKSIGHRAIMAASLSLGTCKVSSVSLSDDIEATINAMRELGAKIDICGDELLIEGIFSANRKPKKQYNIDANESGSTIRFLIPIALLFDGKKVFSGKEGLAKRPLDLYYKIFDEKGIEYNNKTDKLLSLEVKDTLCAGEFEVPGDISSQFITGLLYALPLLSRDSRIIVTSKLESKSYIDLTLNVLDDFGIKIINNNYKEFIISGNQAYDAVDYEVEGDFSQAAFYYCANYMGNDIEILGMSENSLQGDKIILEYIEKLKSAKPGDTLVFDAENCPDIIPVLSACAAVTDKVRTKIINAGRLRIKECDRLFATKSELTKLGAKITDTKDTLTIEGVAKLKGGVTLSSHNDHRIVMMLAILATTLEDSVIINGYKAINKSYPKFFEDLGKLGGNANEC